MQLGLLLFAVLLGLWFAFRYVADERAVPDDTVPTSQNFVQSTVDDETFVDDHWQGIPRAIPPGASDWSSIAGNLMPAFCSACHQSQHEDWKNSLHAGAMSVGLMVQIYSNPAGNQVCLDCHAPLLEQRSLLEGELNARFDKDLSSVGVSCASCHVRDGRVFGPPPSDETMKSLSGMTSIHGGFEASSAFEQSLFCANCHQFEPGVGLMAGVPLENTFNEWSDSPAAQQGQSCQSCHMPGRRHLWKGIHDPAMTAQGLQGRLEMLGSGVARFTVTNTGVGHYFPTYITPRATMVIEARDANNDVLAAAQFVIQRRIDIYLQGQEYDTRLAPDASAQVDLDVRELAGVVRVEAYLKVEPDEFYHRFFENYHVKRGELESMVAAALKQTAESGYNILESALEDW